MKSWTLIPSIFGLWWISAGLSALVPLQDSTWMILIAAAVFVMASGYLPQAPGRLFNKRAFFFGLVAEGLGIVTVLVACSVLHHPDLIMPLIGTVVGLHFLPLAQAFRDRHFIAAGWLMTAVSFLALVWANPFRQAICGIGGGVVLWGFAVSNNLLRFRAVRSGVR